MLQYTGMHTETAKGGHIGFYHGHVVEYPVLIASYVCIDHSYTITLYIYSTHIYVDACSSYIDSFKIYYIPYGRKFWRGIYFGGLAVLRAIRQYFIRQIAAQCDVIIIAKSYQ